jgi:hypothetical protein
MRKRKRRLTHNHLLAAWKRLDRRMRHDYGLGLTSWDHPTLRALHPARERLLRRLNRLDRAIAARDQSDTVFVDTSRPVLA